jgi:hypothetical protein
MFRGHPATAALVLIGTLGVLPARAGVINPNISVIGQPFTRWTNDASDSSPKRVTLDPGEVEMVFDAYLNPYATGIFILALGEEGLELEEGYFTLLRGLPGGVAIKGGRYRVGFGKINGMHPHFFPFAERPRVMGAYLPGEESLAETGVSASWRVPLPGTFSLTAAGDWLQGDTYRIDREPSDASDDPLVLDPEGGDRASEARPAFAGNLSGFGMIGERSGYELALSATGGTNNVAAGARTIAYGAAGKLKLWTAPSAYLLVQGELLTLDREEAAWDSAIGYTRTTVRPLGGYIYADYNFSPRYNAGVLYERFELPTADDTWDQAFGAFAGLSLMEETTSFRLDWNHFMPGTPPGMGESPEEVDTVTLRVIFSMGPHKAHLF